MTAIQNIFCVAVFFHRSVQNSIWNIHPSAEIAIQIWGGKWFPAYFVTVHAFHAFFWRIKKTGYWNSGQTFGTQPEQKYNLNFVGGITKVQQTHVYIYTRDM